MSFGPLIAVCCQAYISELAHGTVVVLAPSELVRVAETARARLACPVGQGIRSPGLVDVFARVMVLSEVAQRLMMMSGSDALNVCSGVQSSRNQPNERGRHNTVPAGHRQSGRPDQELYKIGSGFLHLAPVKGCAVDPNTVKNDGDFARDGDLCLSHADPLGELHAPSLERAPFLLSIKQGRSRPRTDKFEEDGRPIVISCH